MTDFVLEVREPGRPPRRIAVAGPLEVGREVEGLVLADPGISRRHIAFAVEAGALTVADLGSTNGTEVNGARLQGPLALQVGDLVTLGDSSFRLLEVRPDGGGPSPAPAPAPAVAPGSAAATAPPAGPTGQPPSFDEPVAAPAPQAAPQAAPAFGAPTSSASPPPAGPPRPSAARPVLEELEVRPTDSALIRFRPGTAGAKAAAGVAQSARRARKRLAGLGSEPWGVLPNVCLVDPFPDPDQPGQVMTTGTIVDQARNEIWMVVSPESPAEPLERPLALVFGAGLPAGEDLAPLLEGYGLHVADAKDPDPQLREMDLPPMMAAEGEVASLMNLSFVRYLIGRSDRDGFLRFLGSAQPGRLDAAAQQAYGLSMAALEEAWRQKLIAGPPDVKAGQFLRLTMRYLRPHARREAEMFVYMLLGLAFTTVFPFVFKRLLDKAIPSGHFSETVRLLVILTIAFVVSMLADLRRAYLGATVSGSVVRQLRGEMFAKMQHLSQGWYATHEQGDVLSRVFSDVGLLEQGLSQTLREGLFQVLSLVVSSVVLFLLNPWLALVVMGGAPVIALVYKAMAKGAQARSLAVQEETGSVLVVASENYGAQGLVKAFALQAREIGRFKQASDRLFDREVKLQLFGGLFGLSVNMIVTALRVFILGLGAWLILHGHLTVGGLVAFIGLMGEVLSPVTMLTGIGQQIQSATGALVRINEILGAPPEVEQDDGAPVLPPLAHEIRLDDVGFSYTSERRTLDGISATIKAGERVAFVGPTGAGKSSVLQLLMRFYDPDEGAVRFDGQDIRHADLAGYRQQLGVVFQESFLFNATIADNIAMGRPGASEADIEAAARAAELHDFVVSLPRGYNTLVGERGGRLSGGQRQRLAIARALLRDPRVLLLDEATSALDPRTERLIADTLERVGEGRTTVSVTHRLTSITGYDRIFVIVAGQLVEQGTHPELVALNGVYTQLWAEQSGGQAPAQAPFDAVSALAQIPLFAGLGPDDLGRIAERFRSAELRPGESVPEGGGRLVVVRQGRPQVLLPDVTGALAVAADLGPGDCFGLAALLGQPKGAVLRATDAATVLVLDDETIRGAAATFPSVGQALEGVTAPAAAPAGGVRLTRMTMAPMPAIPAPASSAPVPPSPADVRRMTGSLPVVR